MVNDQVELVLLDLDDSEAALDLDPTGSIRIVAGHNPNFSRGRTNADLLIAGHVQGGQVRLPLIGPLMTNSDVPRDWMVGKTELDGGVLYVSRGIGMLRGPAPRIRILTRPELTVIDLVSR